MTINMKPIEQLVKMVSEDAKNFGACHNSSHYKIKLDRDDYIIDIQLSDMPKLSYLETLDDESRALMEDWIKHKIEVMHNWRDLYNRSVCIYNNYCGKRASEGGVMHELVMEGKDIYNVYPFKKAIINRQGK